MGVQKIVADIATGKDVGYDSQIDVVIDSTIGQDREYMGLVITKSLALSRKTEYSLQNKIFWQMSCLKFQFTW